jgi:hypothetical protein
MRHHYQHAFFPGIPFSLPKRNQMLPDKSHAGSGVLGNSKAPFRELKMVLIVKHVWCPLENKVGRRTSMCVFERKAFCA